MAKLFVIGNGRSGTTVLMNALNTNPDIFILGEANIVLYADNPGFRERFNAQHQDFGNQRSKSTYAPALPSLPETATAREYITRLEMEYAWVGDKIAISHKRDMSDTKVMLEQEWRDAEIIWPLRRPRFALASMTRLFAFDDLRRDINVFCRALLWLVDLARIRRRVFVLPIERTDLRAFTIIGSALKLDLTDAAELYTAAPIDDEAFGRDGPCAGYLDRLDYVYDVLLDSIDPLRGTFRPAVLQAEQKLPGFEIPGGLERLTAFGKMVADLITLERETRAAERTG